MNKQDKIFSKWMIVMIVYGGIGIFLGPMLNLFVYGDHWLLFTILKITITVSAFFCLGYPIAHAAGGGRLVVLFLTIIFAAVFFWKPIIDLATGPREINSSRIFISAQIDIYILRSSYALQHNVLYEVDIIGENGKASTVKLTPSQYEKVESLLSECGELSFEILSQTKRLINYECTN